MYVTLFPCNECAKLAIQAGISKIIYLSDKHHDKPEMIASRKLFDMVKIEYERFVPRRKQIVIDYESGMREEMERSILVERHSSNSIVNNSDDEVNSGSLVKTGVGETGAADAAKEEEEELAPRLDALDESVSASPDVSPLRETDVVTTGANVAAVVASIDPVAAAAFFDVANGNDDCSSQLKSSTPRKLNFQ